MEKIDFENESSGSHRRAVTVRSVGPTTGGLQLQRLEDGDPLPHHDEQHDVPGRVGGWPAGRQLQRCRTIGLGKDPEIRGNQNISKRAKTKRKPKNFVNLSLSA